MKRLLFTLLLACLLAGSLALTGCSDGDDGAAGLSAYEIAFAADPTIGTEEEWLASLDPANPLTQAANVDPESCATCHNGSAVRSGDSHQEAYNELFQHGVVSIDPTTISYAQADDGSGGLNDVVTFEMTKNGAAFDCTMADALNIYFTEYTGTDNMEFISSTGSRLSLKGDVTYDAATNVCTSIKAESAYGDLSAVNGLIVVYGQDEFLSRPAGTYISLAKYPFAALSETGAGVAYSSAANTTGCEKCHTTPYYKHGYILADVGYNTVDAGVQDFYTCKACHIDNGSGGHTDWQRMVDDPQGWANDTAQTAQQDINYAYRTSLMNDVHMSHAMEFPYPQSMRNCVTCHEGKLSETLADTNFTLETCKSCHPINGGKDTCLDKEDNVTGDDGADGVCDLDRNGNEIFAVDTIDTALKTLMTFENSDYDHVGAGIDVDDPTQNCNGCHEVGGFGPSFMEVHTGGYNPVIYTATGVRYADQIVASIDGVSMTGTTLIIDASATGSVGGLSAADITPTLMVGLYGWDSKDFIVGPHERDADRNRLLEWELGDDPNPRVSGTENSPGDWTFTADLSMWADLIANGTVKRAEVAIMPLLADADGNEYATNAVNETFDLDTNDFDDTFFAPIVDVENCNTCHDALATTFHGPERGGSVVVCRMCHITRAGGSHLQGQSRSIDSYAHAIHSFQPFDIEDIDFTDPVEEKHYEEHIGFLFPDFATINCEACHNPGAFNVPDQSKSMPGLLSATEEITGVLPLSSPEVVTGPAARACGGCHRAQFMNADDLAGAQSFNQHTKEFGYRIENDDDDNVLNKVIETIMTLFE